MTLLLVDGSNILLRCAFGGDVPPEASTPAAIAMIERAARQVRATHMVVALDYTDAPSWRKVEYPEYKAHRTTSTAEWLIYGAAQMSARRWHVEMLAGYEADDIIATIAKRSAPRSVVVLSNDSDLLSLTAIGASILRPAKDGAFESLRAPDVCAKYEIPSAAFLYDYKAMVGESGDNIAGVPGVGPKRASALLNKFAGLEEIIAGGYSKDSALVYQHADAARLAYRLVRLSDDAPVPPIMAGLCALPSARVA